MLTSLAGVMVIVLSIWVSFRFVDLISRERLGIAFQFNMYGFFFWLEIALFVTPALLLWPKKQRSNAGVQFLAAMLMMLAGTLYRFNVYLIAFNPGPGWSYFPSIPETTITLGLIALEVVAYLVIVKRFPILAGAQAPAAK
jgi:Ni/Fe-hydrogenase subunit HybB-like protein